MHRIPRMRGTLIKLLVHALRALSRASKNNWSQKAQAKKSPTWPEPCGAWVTTSFVVCRPESFYSKGKLSAVRCGITLGLFHLYRLFLCFKGLEHRLCKV